MPAIPHTRVPASAVPPTTAIIADPATAATISELPATVHAA
ncbi:hypothetical protein PV761_15590 [Arthrobacter sp. CC3]